MKLNIDKLKNMPSKNKIMLGVGISLIIVALISTTYFIFNSKKAIDTKKIEISEEQTEDIEKAQKEEESAEKELEEAKKSGDEKAIKEAEEKVAKVKEKVEAVKVAQSSSKAKTDSKASNTTKSSSDTKTSTPTASAGTSNNTQTTPKEPEKKKVWVVDVPATTKTVEVPVTKYRPTWWVKLRDNKTLKIFYSEREAYDYAGNNGLAWGDSPQDEAYTVMEKQTVKVEEQGHWEYR